jgi:hypothetical protein
MPRCRTLQSGLPNTLRFAERFGFYCLHDAAARFCRNPVIFADKFAVMDEEEMGEVINLRRVRKTQQRTREETRAAANRLAHGTPKHLRRAAKAEKQRADQKIKAHALDPEKR